MTSPKARATYLAIVVVLFLLLLGVVTGLAVLYFGCKREAKEHRKEDGPVHLRPLQLNQQQGAAEGLAFLREGWSPGAAEPCQDFYRYACGNWSLHHPLPPGRRQYDTLTLMRDGVRAKLVRDLEELTKTRSGGASTNSSALFPGMEKTLKLYESCLSLESELREQGQFVRNPLVALLDDSEVGMWPLLRFYWRPQDAKMDPEALAGLLAGGFGVASLVEPVIEADWADPSRSALYLRPAQLTLGAPGLYLNSSRRNPYLRQYRRMVAAVAEELGREMGGMLPITAASDVAGVVATEVSLATFINATEPRGNVTLASPYHRYTLVQLRKEFPGFHWDDYLKRLLPAEVHGRLDSVVLTNPAYVRLLSSFVHRAQPKALYNYLIWRLVENRLWALAGPYRQVHHSLKELLDARHHIASRRLQCLEYVESASGLAIGRLFVENHYDQRLSPVVEGLASELLAAYRRDISSSHWMDPPTRELAMKKLDALKVHVAYPEKLLNDSWMEAEYSNLTLSSDAYSGFFGLFNDVTRWKGRDAAFDLLRPNDRGEWRGPSAAETNAWYSPSRNALTIPAGLLQAPLFRAAYPRPLQLGALGSVVGHELAHGFGLVGGLWGPEGQHKLWLDEASIGGLLKRRQCLASQLDGFCYPDIHMCLRGEQMVGESMADLTGLRIAFTALKSQNASGSKDRSTEPLLFGTLRPDQAFFLSYARLWCGEVDGEGLGDALRLDPHPPDKARVVAALSNTDAFAGAWHCARGDPMVHAKSC